MCTSLLGAVWHASLASISFLVSHPAPECMLMTLQLVQALRQQRRGSVLSFADCGCGGLQAERVFQSAQALSPLHKFQVLLQACGM